MRANALDRRNDSLSLGRGWQWLTARGELIAPPDMETRHLFHTVSMIWNHGMPANAATHDFARYRFNPDTHGPQQLRTAIAMMLPVLLAREDLTDAMRARLDFMRTYLTRNPGFLPAPVLALEHAP